MKVCHHLYTLHCQSEQWHDHCYIILHVKESWKLIKGVAMNKNSNYLQCIYTHNALWLLHVHEPATNVSKRLTWWVTSSIALSGSPKPVIVSSAASIDEPLTQPRATVEVVAGEVGVTQSCLGGKTAGVNAGSAGTCCQSSAGASAACGWWVHKNTTQKWSPQNFGQDLKLSGKSVFWEELPTTSKLLMLRPLQDQKGLFKEHWLCSWM